MKPFGTYFRTIVRNAGLAPRACRPGECHDAAGTRCRLCFAGVLTYEREAELKQKALQQFWNENVRDASLEHLVLSPMGRGYRTVTKRRVFHRGKNTVLGLIDPGGGRLRPFAVPMCAIEPEYHGKIYKHLQDAFNAGWASPLAEELRYVIIRGTYREFAVLFNVGAIRPEVVKTANTLSKSLTHNCPGVSAVYLLDGGTDDRYYLGGNVPFAPRKFRKLYGARDIHLRLGGGTFLYSPLSFSQVNESAIASLVRAATDLLQPEESQRLFDLYCGYGLFSILLAPLYRGVVGIEVLPQSVQFAIANAGRLHRKNTSFRRSEISDRTVRALAHALTQHDAVLLDPPRGGTGPGVIEHIAVTRPSNVVHIFCNLDILPQELNRWTRSGFRIHRAVPVDMFPGTSDVEVLVALRPAAIR